MKSPRGLAAPVIPNLVAGLTSGLVSLVYCVSFAALIFSDTLAPHFLQGVGVALVGAMVTAIMVAWRSPFSFTLAGPEANSAIVLALSARSIATALAAPGKEAFLYPTVWAAIVLSTAANGLALYLLGRFRMGQFARYIPYPVIGGFLAGTGWLIARSSFKVMTGVPLGIAEFSTLMHPAMALQWTAGVAVAATLFVALTRFRHFLGLPILLLGGIALGNILRLVLRRSFFGINPEEWFFQPFSQQGVWEAWNYTTLSHIDWPVLGHQAGTLVAMVMIVVLSILLNSTGLELATGRNVNLNAQLRAEGISNLVNGACGGMVGYVSINRSLLNQRAGANSPLAGIISGCVCGSVLLFGSSVLSYIPKPLLGGLLLYIGANLLIRWAIQSWSKLPRFDYLLVILILVIIGTLGFLPGIGLGVLISCLLFIVSYGKTSSVKHRVSGQRYHSNVVRSAPQQKLLEQEGDSIAILVLHGFVFFGTANDLVDGIRRRLEEKERTRLAYVVFDFRLVTGLDSSAVLSFIKLAQLAEKAQLNLVFTHASPVIDKQMRQGGLTAENYATFASVADQDRGIEWCENEILKAHRMLEVPSSSLGQQLETLFNGESFASGLVVYLQRVELKEGRYLFREGEQSDGLYFVESGRVSVVLELANGTTLRRRTYAGGTILGEMGFFSGERRSASVVADQASELHYLSKEAFTRMEAAAPLLASAFSKGIVNLLAERLRHSEEEVKTLLQ